MLRACTSTPVVFLQVSHFRTTALGSEARDLFFISFRQWVLKRPFRIYIHVPPSTFLCVLYGREGLFYEEDEASAW